MTGFVVTIYEPDDVLFEQVSRVYEAAGRMVRRVESVAELASAGGDGLVVGPGGEAGVVIQDCHEVHVHYHWPEGHPKE